MKTFKWIKSNGWPQETFKGGAILPIGTGGVVQIMETIDVISAVIYTQPGDMIITVKDDV